MYKDTIHECDEKMCSNHYQTEILMKGHAKYVVNVSHVKKKKVLGGNETPRNNVVHVPHVHRNKTEAW